MSGTVISVENLSKSYRLGVIGTGTFRGDIHRWWAKQRGKPDPYQIIGQADNGNRQNETLWALKDINFQVQQGEALGIIGRNGAGKSTLLKILSRVTAPTLGIVKVKGRIASLLEVGTGFHPELTGRENIYLNGAIMGMSRAEVGRKFDEIVDFSGVEKFIDTPVKRYSSGMYVRLAFAVAAHLEPEILVVDEVLAVGDAEFQRKCLGKMGDVAYAGRTVLFVSHNMVAIEGLCPRALVLEKGGVVFDGNSTESISRYIHVKKELKQISLRDRTDRVGTGIVRAVDISIFDKSGEPTNHIGMGENFCVEIRTQGKLDKAIIGILIGNIYRTQIMRGYTWEQIADDIELSGDDVIRCYFEETPLMHGTYDIHVWLGQQGHCVDYIESAAELVIDPKDIYSSGRILDPAGGMFFCKVEWDVNKKRLRNR
jgi:lipopolysaccharide transport system ATP-binding protein